MKNFADIKIETKRAMMMMAMCMCSMCTLHLIMIGTLRAACYLELFT